MGLSRCSISRRQKTRRRYRSAVPDTRERVAAEKLAGAVDLPVAVQVNGEKRHRVPASVHAVRSAFPSLLRSNLTTTLEVAQADVLPPLVGLSSQVAGHSGVIPAGAKSLLATFRLNPAAVVRSSPFLRHPVEGSPDHRVWASSKRFNSSNQFRTTWTCQSRLRASRLTKTKDRPSGKTS